MKRRLNIFLGICFLAGVVVISLNRPAMCAEDKYSIKEMTPDVKTALDNRRDRYDRLRELKAKGAVGENNRGYVEVLGDNPQAKTIAEAENKDREVIYKTIANQNDLSGALPTIEKVFGQVQRDKASPGDKIQGADGQWVTK